MIPAKLERHHKKLRACRKCPDMKGCPVHGSPIAARVLVVGQAPGPHEGDRGRPFAHTAGKTLFKWLHQATGAEEARIRETVYFSAVARCFPGKALKGAGDRVPTQREIENCREHLAKEIDILKPELVIAVGRLAMTEVLADAGFSKASRLEDFVGRIFKVRLHGREVEVIPLPHPSGVSRWPLTEPGKSRLAQALKLLEERL
jgi:uracil-DNA glycosylase